MFIALLAGDLGTDYHKQCESGGSILSNLNMTKSVLFYFQFCKNVSGSWIPGVGPCSIEVCKTRSCPTLRLKKEPRYSNRNVSGFLDRGSYMSKDKSPRMTSYCAWQTAGKAWQQSPLLRGLGSIYRGNFCWWVGLCSLPVFWPEAKLWWR